ncbi:hypothetical protein Q5741_21275 [Paenibacillus sp. JX-17]|uniref:Uncharacterized protein n=1 Tax=Paenibacillus lacisoli TaxID=3064525 RepID=A0ABT9CI30_9BACL|nr:hypothetical protein [Paenibacillus sp. JX-17]MDO7908910.1 hypothetical protein [Paenibacillus sp. JX-17]
MKDMWIELKKEVLILRDTTPLRFLECLIYLIKNNQNILMTFFTKEKLETDMFILKFITQLDIKDYYVGSTGNDYELIIKKSIEEEPTDYYSFWKFLSNMVLDLVVFVTDKVCPNCKSDHLRVLTDREQINIYLYCETCFLCISEVGENVEEKELLPANIQLIQSCKCNF